MKGVLYIVATPIGNHEDITLRALSVLRMCDLVACEDTRVSRKLLGHYNIQKPLVSFHQHSGKPKFDSIIQSLHNGKNIALITDAGTPGISDPGNMLVAHAVEQGIDVVSIPGPSALSAALSIAGIDMQKFVFLGFPPHKKGRETFFKEVAASKYPVIYYDSPHRILKNLELLESINSQQKVIIGRELTKMFEEMVRVDISGARKYFQDNPSKVRGEFVVIAF